jgi:hypothetical protein
VLIVRDYEPGSDILQRSPLDARKRKIEAGSLHYSAAIAIRFMNDSIPVTVYPHGAPAVCHSAHSDGGFGHRALTISIGLGIDGPLDGPHNFLGRDLIGRSGHIAFSKQAAAVIRAHQDGQT